MKAVRRIFIALGFGLFCLILYLAWIFLSLPKLFSIKDYQPPLLTRVYDSQGEKIGEFFNERRLIAPYQDIPESTVQAFVSAEDGRFFSHKGLNYRAIARAFVANLKAGKKVQGGSTITQQLARTLLLSSKKTYTRKLKEAILALRMENSLSKQDILFIYLNQIYFGHGAYGLEMAARTYFRKPAKELSLAESALLAGLPKAPGRFSPVLNPAKAKSRQLYVLNRMRQEGYIDKEEMIRLSRQNLQVFVRRDFSALSPYYLETVRRLLLPHIASKELLKGGFKIHTAMDVAQQKAAQAALKKGLEELDKRRGFRGPLKNLSQSDERLSWAKQRDSRLRSKIKNQFLIPGLSLWLEGEDETPPPSFFREFKKKFSAIEQRFQSRSFWFESRKALEGEVFPALVSKATDKAIEVMAPWGKETLPLKDFNWAVPVKDKEKQAVLLSAEEIFKPHDVALFRVRKGDGDLSSPSESIPLELYQEPEAEGALLAFDLQSGGITALVGGYDYSRSQYNRAWQSRRQSGSVFKPFVYGAALEKGFQPGSIISDSPVVFSKEEAEVESSKSKEEESAEGQEEDLWRPSNINNRFLGDIIFRKAFVRSLNVPTVRISEKIGWDWLAFYVRRLGIFSPLNKDYTSALGSSSISLYECLKAFSVFALGGRGMAPVLIRRVEDSMGGEVLSDLSLDEFFKEEMALAGEFVKKEQARQLKRHAGQPFEERWSKALAEDSPYLIPPSNAYVMMNLLEAVARDPEGTARRALSLDRPIGGKTGTSDGYYDTWFVGASPFVSAGVWMGFDSEKTLGRGETGSRTALPVWIQYMSESHKDLPPLVFPVPDNVVFVNIDTQTGSFANSKSRDITEQAFIKGSEPKALDENLPSSLAPAHEEEEIDFLKEDLSR